MEMNKRAQFFLLAAVIIVAVVISLGVTKNRTIVSEEPINFYDFSYEVNKEIGAVLDYAIYSGFDDDVNLTEFVNLLAEDIRDKDSEVNFVITYGDNVSGVRVRNEGSTSIFVDEQGVEGRGAIVVSKVCDSLSCNSINSSIAIQSSIGIWEISAVELIGKKTIELGVHGQIVEFPISRHKKVVFIIQKDVGDESFIAIK